jgi:uncharacterized membrane protein
MSGLEAAAFAAILGMAVATYITRVSGMWLMRRLQVRGRAKAALDAMPPAILMAVVAPQALTGGIAESLAAAVTVLAALRLPLIVAVIVGVGAVVAFRALIG